MKNNMFSSIKNKLWVFTAFVMMSAFFSCKRCVTCIKLNAHTKEVIDETEQCGSKSDINAFEQEWISTQNYGEEYWCSLEYK